MKRTILFIAVGTLLIGLVAESAIARKKRVTETFNLNKSKVYEIEIDIDVAELIIEPSDEKTEGSVMVVYDNDSYDFRFKFSQSQGLVRINLEKDGLFRDTHHGSNAPEVTIYLPYNSKIELYVHTSAGTNELELGGLTILKAEISLSAGELELSFKEPNRVTMASLDITARVGEVRLHYIGNAKSKEIDIDADIGKTDVDLRGEHVDDAYISIDNDMGETIVTLPDRNVGVKIRISQPSFFSEASLYGIRKNGRHYYNDSYDKASKRINVNVSTGIGNLDIDVR